MASLGPGPEFVNRDIEEKLLILDSLEKRGVLMTTRRSERMTVKV